jgi:muramoyltetrapeptide carboxypeptidase
MLTHLRLSGSLRALAGMAVGHIRWADSERIPGLAWQQLEEINLYQGPGPVGAGLASGHSAPNLTLPLGLRARLSSDEASLIFGPSE